MVHALSLVPRVWPKLQRTDLYRKWKDHQTTNTRVCVCCLISPKCWQIIPTLRGSILQPPRASQVPYNTQKIYNYEYVEAPHSDRLRPGAFLWGNGSEQRCDAWRGETPRACSLLGTRQRWQITTQHRATSHGLGMRCLISTKCRQIGPTTPGGILQPPRASQVPYTTKNIQLWIYRGPSL